MIKKLILFFIATSCAIGVKAQGLGSIVPDLDWLKTYSQRSNINNVPTALDVVSNAYTTGFQNISASVVGMVTLKYDSLGNNIFAIGYSNGTYDEGTSVQVDASGNVYCSGISYSSASNRDYVVIKYSPTGVQQFLVKYNGSGNGIDEAYDLKLDAASNVYVVGKSRNSAGNYDIVVLKYSSSGTLIWTKIINNGFDDIGTAMVLSSGGAYVYITGTSVNSSSNTDIVTYCLNSGSGATVWNKTAAGTGSSNDYVSAIVLSGANVVICGYLYNSDNDYVTIKYNGAAGTLMWQKSYAFASGTDDHATALVKDSAARIAVTGTTKNGTVYEYHTVLYDSTGTQLWVNKESTGFSTIDVNPHIATDTIGNYFYVSGQIQKATSDIYAYQITSSGVTTWKQAIDGADADRDAATNICVNGLGEVFLAAQCHNVASSYDIATLKIGQTPVYYPVDNLNETPNQAIAFTENRGQLFDVNGLSVPATTVQYYTENTTPHFFFNNAKMSFIFQKYDTVLTTIDSIKKIDLNFIKSNPNAKLLAHEQWPSSKAYFISQYPDGVKNIMGSKYLLIPNIYPYIDLHYSSNASGIKYYFVVKPGGDPNNIQQQFVGASLTTNVVSGDLTVSTSLGSLKLEKAYAYQVMPTSTTTYDILPLAWTGDWTNSGTNQYRFNVGTYNASLPLIFEVDQGNAIITAPSSLNNTWNTFVGGDHDDIYTDLKLDKNGNIYTLQDTKSQTFWTTPYTIGQTFAYTNGAQIYKFNKYGVLVKQTYMGGPSSGVRSNAIAVLSDSTVVLVGGFASSLPTLTTPPGAYTNSSGSSFIVKFGNDLSTIQWCTHYQGYIQDVDVNSNNDIYVLAWGLKAAGLNSGYIFNKTNALNLSTLTGSRANVVTRFDQNGVTNWSSYIPCIGLGSIKVDRKRNNYYVFGEISDTSDFKHFNKYNTFYQPVINSYNDAYIQKFTSNDTIKVSTLFGGNNDDALYEAEIMPNGEAYFVGYSLSSDYSAISYNPGSGAYINTHGKVLNSSRGWICRFDSIMTRKWATTFGDSISNSGFRGITKDSTNNVYIGGQSYAMPTFNGLVGAYFQGGTLTGNSAFLRFDASNKLNWATYMGGSYSMAGIRSLAYNKGTNNLCFAGGAGVDGAGYPFANFTSPQAYWQGQNYSSGCSNCVANDDAFIGRFALIGLYVGIEEIQLDKLKRDLLVYPNPTNDNIIIKISEEVNRPYKINVVNILGETVQSRIIDKDYNLPQTLSFLGLKTGMYIINVVSDEMNKTAKIIKE